jgi:hypothetical protein
VPDRTPAEVSVTPLGRGPVFEKVEFGKLVAVTVKLPALPTVKVVELALVMVGARFTKSVKFWVAFVPTPLVAVITIE